MTIMANDKLLAMIMKNGEDYTVWYPEIPADEPLLVALLEKYEASGGSVCGTKEDIIADISESI